jgi:alpha-amylase/alpha-mannosidase (GH57 family)
MTSHYFSIHAHFYQPPREDPLTGVIPQESGSHPYSNWNEKIHAECYRPNSELGNFGRISFNVGPTLCTWMEKYDPQICDLIVSQDRANVERYGVGNAMAQAYNHTILPLASYQDKVTQVAWGIADFKHRFGRQPSGMWLPETAVDLETLTVLAERGIEYTILAPWQAVARGLDPTEPYWVDLPQERRIAVFFYHQELSGGISFNPDMTINADDFVRDNLGQYFNPDKARKGKSQILLIASDGELYGHHQRHREYFLSRLVDGASSLAGYATTYPGLWMRRHPPERVIGIREYTSWSCHHGVERWRADCACSVGDSEWKASLRAAFDRLSTDLDEVYVNSLRPYIRNPWSLRNRYIEVILGEGSVESLIAEVAGGKLPQDMTRLTHMLLEAQRERQRMYTSCGWFFGDLDRIEPKNNIAYAAQAVRLVRMATGIDLAPGVLANLRQVISPNTGVRGDKIFQRHLKRANQDGRIVAGA